MTRRFAALSLVLLLSSVARAQHYSTDTDVGAITREHFDAYLLVEKDSAIDPTELDIALRSFAAWASPKAPERILLEPPVEMLAAFRACTSDPCRDSTFDIIDIPYMYTLHVQQPAPGRLVASARLLDTAKRKAIGAQDRVTVYVRGNSVSFSSLDTPRVGQVLTNIAEGRPELQDEAPTPPWSKRFGVAALGGVRYGDSISPVVGGRLVLDVERVRLILEVANYFAYRQDTYGEDFRRTDFFGSLLAGYTWPQAWGALYGAIGPQIGRTCFYSVNERYDDEACGDYRRVGAQFGGKILAGAELALTPRLAAFADAGFQIHAAGSPAWPELLAGLRLWIFQ